MAKYGGSHLWKAIYIRFPDGNRIRVKHSYDELLDAFGFTSIGSFQGMIWRIKGFGNFKLGYCDFIQDTGEIHIKATWVE